MKTKHILLLLFLILLFLNGCTGTEKKTPQSSKLDEIKSIISRDPAKINKGNEFGYTLLHISARENKIEIVKYLVSQGADVNAQDDFNEIPLFKAVRRANIELIKYLVYQGSKINTLNIRRESPLHAAVIERRLDIAKFLVSQGAEVNTKDINGESLLHEAVYQNDLELIRYLTSQGAEVNVHDKYDVYPIHNAAYDGRLEIVRQLISQGADVNVRGAWAYHRGPLYRTFGCTPLHLAAQEGHLKIVEYLILHGADVKAKNNLDDTALSLAEKSRHTEIVSLLSSAEELTNLSSTIKTIEKPADKKTPPKEFTKSRPFAYTDIDFGSYYALVIGNNNYQNLPQLVTAKNDAQEVAETLKNLYGFSIELLIDASRADILLSLLYLRNNLSYHDNLLVYYAGHGWLDKEGGEGYWLPTDAEKNNMINWISNSSITTTLRAMRAKHVLIVADSCYSGTLARGIRTVDRTPGYISRLSQKRARSVISSGGIEPVIDSGGKGLHSVFASAFLNALEGNKEIMDGVQLFNKLRRPVMLNSDQTPEFSDIRKAGHEGGEFLFVRKK
ncbi:MAG: ankyrin repeat domain-containing protein [Desulfobacteraceae bacterium]|jgi:ankyrin repeat protein